MPILPMVKAIYCLDSLAIFTCQNPLFKSMHEKMWAPTMVSIISGILGRGWVSFSVLLFSHLKLIQNLKVPSFFHTNMTALHQGEVDGWIALPFNISCKCWHTSSIRGGAILRNLSLKGSLFVNLMTCSVVSVHPISFFSNEKTWELHQQLPSLVSIWFFPLLQHVQATFLL